MEGVSDILHLLMQYSCRMGVEASVYFEVSCFFVTSCTFQQQQFGPFELLLSCISHGNGVVHTCEDLTSADVCLQMECATAEKSKSIMLVQITVAVVPAY